uniref:Ribosomal protein L16 n=1 Tax=Xiphosiphonia pinnulata TaxID=2305477 RepID=UPI0022FD75D8|nr:Ribosomal protein L16 [Xiphosiphonia pinnulata]WAX03973.1 Ribosomal protein L16 [Xiphosiphonia pinnulata]
MKNNNIQKKNHFKFKRLLTFKKHILKIGAIGFKINQTCCINDSQESLLKLIILKTIKKISLIKVKIFFNSKCFYSATKLPLESRMGKGKGEICHSFGYYKKGFILFELKTFSITKAIKLQKQLDKKKIIKLKTIF